MVRDNVLTVDRDGNLECNNIGIIPTPTNKTVNITSTNVDVYVAGATVSLSKGKWILLGFATFPSNGTSSQRRVQLYNVTSSSSLRTIASQGQNYHAEDIIDILEIESGTYTYAVRVSAGVAINNVATYIKAIRIA